MRTILKAVSLLFLSTVSAKLALAVDYITKYSVEPIPIFNQTGTQGKGQKLYLVGLEGDELIFKYDPNRPQEIGMPLDTEGLKLYFEYPKRFFQARESINNGDYTQAVAQLRDIAYPLVQYVLIPEASFNGQEVIELLTQALVNTEEYDEAIALVRELPLAKMRPIFLRHSLKLASRLIEIGRNKDALKILKGIPLGAEQIDYFPEVMDFAQTLLLAEQFDEALFLYQRIQLVKSSDFYTLATLWTAYCNIEIEKYESAKIFLSLVEDTPITSEAYSLMLLIKAKLALLIYDDVAAMGFSSKGMVYSDVSDFWAPELLYTTGICYDKLQNQDTAKEIFSELNLVYPSSSWAKRGDEKLKELFPSGGNN